jgi:hypothetical protein
VVTAILTQRFSDLWNAVNSKGQIEAQQVRAAQGGEIPAGEECDDSIFALVVGCLSSGIVLVDDMAEVLGCTSGAVSREIRHCLNTKGERLVQCLREALDRPDLPASGEAARRILRNAIIANHLADDD